ncbi:hypothetical protein BT96DRAFT_169095 [Gymnopus androsaceus JB14]|uniref:Uncharacterized protein n=1 Tax=Gymnopus androsaceus JB14 TaxID=1447944 RepID=A0A6A4HA00_9AGAR|nr:hypothetical protein BT96DRAFT_169095 [Gymnopus androsaceus JB14]
MSILALDVVSVPLLSYAYGSSLCRSPASVACSTSAYTSAYASFMGFISVFCFWLSLVRCEISLWMYCMVWVSCNWFMVWGSLYRPGTFFAQGIKHFHFALIIITIVQTSANRDGACFPGNELSQNSILYQASCVAEDEYMCRRHDCY